MKFIIHTSIFKLFPELRIGVLTVKNADNSKKHKQIVSFLREQERTVAKRITAKPITADLRIASMREAHKAFHSKPKKYHPSAEALIRRAFNQNPLPIINPLVDIYNAISLKYIMPAGGEDLDKISGDIMLARADGTENFVALSETNNCPPKKGEVIYKDNIGVICRRMNWREADRTKLDNNTHNAVLVIESLPPITKEELYSALEEMTEMVKKYCKAEVQTKILNKDNSEIKIK